MAKEKPDTKKEAYKKPALKKEGQLKDITAGLTGGGGCGGGS